MDKEKMNKQMAHTFKGIPNKQVAINTIDCLLKAIDYYKTLDDSSEVRRQIIEWNSKIHECKCAIRYFDNHKIESEVQDGN